MGVITSLAGAQLRHRPGRWALLAVGVALAMALPVIAAGTGQVVSADTLRRTVADLDPGDRGILVTDNRSIYDRGPTTALDTVISTQLQRISSSPVRKELVFRQLTTAGSTFFLGAVDQLASGVQLETGRLPRTCTRTRCEVVIVGSGNTSALTKAAASLGVVVVGTARRTDPLVVSGSFDTRGVPLLLGGDPNAIALLSSLTLFSRTYGWVVPLDVQRVLDLGVPTYVHRSSEALDVISAQSLGINSYPPDAALAAADARAALSARRFGLLGGSTAVLLLGFAMVAAVGLRREHAVLVGVLRRRGARWPAVTRLTLVEAATTVVLGAVAGCLLGAAVCAVTADHAQLPVAATVGQALSDATGAVLVLTLLAIGLAAAVLLWPDTESKTAWRTLDLVALAGLGAAVLAASRGSVVTGALARHTDPLLVALPALAAVTSGLVAARLWLPWTRVTERVLPRRSLAGRIGLLGAVRRPLRAVATTAFLTAAISSVVFAGAYRSTLLQGAADQAAYAVPLDATLHSSQTITTPLAVTDPERLAGVAPGITAYGLVRSSAVVRTGTGDSAALPLIGIDPKSLTEVRRWERTTGSTLSPSRLGQSLSAAESVASAVPAPTLPAGSRKVSIAVSGQLTDVQLSLWVSTAAGREGAVALTQHGDMVTGVIPDLGPGELHAVGMTLREDPAYATRHQHSIGEGNTDQPDLAGKLHIGAVTIDGAPTAWSWAGWRAGLANTTATAGGLDVAYRLSGALVVVQPGYRDPGTAAAVPVVVDPATASTASGGVVTLSLGQTKLTGRVVGVLPRMPTAAGRFAVIDQRALTHILDGQQPGTGAVTELWVAASNDHASQALDAALAHAPYDQAAITERRSLAAGLVSDPVARGSRLLLALAAGLALLVAGAAIVLLVVGDRRDDAGELNSWESDGVRPATLRRVLLVRALSVVAVAVPIGLLGGLVLARVGADLVAVDAAGSTPRPPLHVTVGPLWSGGILLVGLGLAVGLAAFVAATSLREPLPVRPELELR